MVIPSAPIGTGVLGREDSGLGQFYLGETSQQNEVFRPFAKVQIAFDTVPTAVPTWTDVTPYLKSFGIRRGRRSELDRVDAGQLDIDLVNDDRRFEPKYPGSPYYPNVEPERMIQVSVVYKGTEYYLFTGYIEGYPQKYEDEAHAYVSFTAVDGFSVLAGKKLNVSFPSQFSGFRVNAVLDEADWLSVFRFVMDGVSNLIGVDLEDDNALNHLQLVTQSEGGKLFVAGNGDLTFLSRHAQFFAIQYLTDQAVFGESVETGEIPYTEVEPDSQKAYIRNEFIYSRVDGAEQLASDATSQAKYFTKTDQVADLLVDNDYELKARVDYLLSFYKDSQLRLNNMQLVPTGDPDLDDVLYPQMFGRELFDRVRVRKLPPAGGQEIDQASWIEYIQIDLQDGEYKTTFGVSPVSEQDFWILELSALDTEARLAF